jgi:hypothetical protein
MRSDVHDWHARRYLRLRDEDAEIVPANLLDILERHAMKVPDWATRAANRIGVRFNSSGWVGSAAELHTLAEIIATEFGSGVSDWGERVRELKKLIADEYAEGREDAAKIVGGESC